MNIMQPVWIIQVQNADGVYEDFATCLTEKFGKTLQKQVRIATGQKVQRMLTVKRREIAA
jgi:hypothetical protein